MLDLSGIDWSATSAYVWSLPWALVLVLVSIPPTRPFILRLAADPRSHGTLALAALTSAAMMVIAVAEHSDDGWFGQEAAAWMQAFGAIGALAIAIWADHRAADRIREDRKAEWDKQRQDHEDDRMATRSARLAVLKEASSALRDAAAAVGDAKPGALNGAPMPRLAVERLSAAEAALDYFMRQQAELDMNVLGALTRTQQVVARAKEDIGKRWDITIHPGTADATKEALSKAAAEIHAFREYAEAGVFDLT